MMYTKLKNLILALLLAVAVPARGHFEDTALGVRPAGFAGAYTAGEASPESLYYNPAALALVREAQLSSSYSRLFMGLTDKSNLGEGFVGAALPLGSRYSLGAGWQNFSLAKYYSENTFYLGFAGEITGRLYGGLSLKMLKKEYGQTDYTENSVNLETGAVSDDINPVFAGGYSVTGFTPDIGVLYEFSNRISAGLSLSNILQPDMALSSDDTDSVPMISRLGLKYRIDEMEFLADMSYRDEDFNFALGAQKDFSDVASVRGGLALGSRDYRELALGASLNHGGILRIDYAFSYPLGGIRGTYGTHRVGLSLKFGDIMSREISEEDRMQAVKLLREAEGYMDRGDFDEAIKLLSRARRLDRANEEVSVKREQARQLRTLKRNLERDARRQYLGGVNELERGNFEEALEYFSSVMAVEDRGWEEIVDIKNRASAKLDELSGRKSEYVDGLVSQAGSLMDREDYAGAKEILDRALALERRDQALRMLTNVHDNLIRQYYTEGMNLFLEERYSRALQRFEMIVEMDSQHSQALDMIERIRSIEGR